MVPMVCTGGTQDLRSPAAGASRPKFCAGVPNITALLFITITIVSGFKANH